MAGVVVAPVVDAAGFAAAVAAEVVAVAHVVIL